MHFHVQLIDDETAPERRAANREAHWDYFDAHAEHFVARGATATDDLARTLSSVLFVEFDGWDAVREFVDNEPMNANGVYREVHVRRWHDGLGRRQRDVPRRDGQAYWYVRGYGRPGAHARRNALLDAHLAYFAPHDAEDFVVRGAVLDDSGRVWRGSANLIALPDRAAVEAFLADEPFFRAGLYDRVVVARYRFGGRPGQVV